MLALRLSHNTIARLILWSVHEINFAVSFPVMSADEYFIFLNCSAVSLAWCFVVPFQITSCSWDLSEPLMQQSRALRCHRKFRGQPKKLFPLRAQKMPNSGAHRMRTRFTLLPSPPHRRHYHRLYLEITMVSADRRTSECVLPSWRSNSMSFRDYKELQAFPIYSPIAQR